MWPVIARSTCETPGSLLDALVAMGLVDITPGGCYEAAVSELSMLGTVGANVDC